MREKIINFFEGLASLAHTRNCRFGVLVHPNFSSKTFAKASKPLC
jgi:hypothetical protein